jgi:hypothetical protein
LWSGYLVISRMKLGWYCHPSQECPSGRCYGSYAVKMLQAKVPSQKRTVKSNSLISSPPPNIHEQKKK